MSENAIDVNTMGQAQDMDDMDWDDIPTDEFDSVDEGDADETSMEQSEDSDSELGSEETSEQDSESAEPTSDNKEEDNSGKEESDKEDSKEVESKEESKESEELIEVKIDGEIQKVSLDELKSNYSGKVAWDKRFSEIDQERKQISAERDSLQEEINSVNQYVSELGEKMKNVSMMEGLYEIAALNNIGPHQVKHALIAEILPEINRMAEMDPAAIELEFSRQELEYQKSMQQKEQERFSAQQAQRELQDQINSVLTKYDIEMDEYKEAEKFLSARKDEVGEVTPELVGDYVVFAKAESRAENLLTNFDSGKHSGNNEVMNGLIDIVLQNPSFTDDDINEILEDVLGKAQQEVAKQKVEASSAKKQPKQAQVKKKTVINDVEVSEGSDDWDDIL